MSRFFLLFRNSANCEYDNCDNEQTRTCVSTNFRDVKLLMINEMNWKIIKKAQNKFILHLLKKLCDLIPQKHLFHIIFFRSFQKIKINSRAHFFVVNIRAVPNCFIYGVWFYNSVYEGFNFLTFNVVNR